MAGDNQNQSKQDMDDIETRFTQHPWGAEKAARCQDIRTDARNLAVTITLKTPSSRERSLALTKVEEAVFWANAAISRRK